MPGQTSDSELPWTTLSLREEGGVAGLGRLCSVTRDRVPPALLQRIDAIVGDLNAGARRPAAQADDQRLVVTLQRGGTHVSHTFDRADLPPPVQALFVAIRGIAPWRPAPVATPSDASDGQDSGTEPKPP